MAITITQPLTSSLNPAPAGSSVALSFAAEGSQIGEGPYSLVLDGADSFTTVHLGKSGKLYTVSSRTLYTSVDEGDTWSVESTDVIRPALF